MDALLGTDAEEADLEPEPLGVVETGTLVP
jgi:hypothetical protein